VRGVQRSGRTKALGSSSVRGRLDLQCAAVIHTQSGGLACQNALRCMFHSLAACSSSLCNRVLQQVRHYAACLSLTISTEVPVPNQSKFKPDPSPSSSCPAGTASEELPYVEEFFLPGSGASRGLTSTDLEANRTQTWDDVIATVSIDDVEKPGAAFPSQGLSSKMDTARRHVQESTAAAGTVFLSSHNVRDKCSLGINALLGSQPAVPGTLDEVSFESWRFFDQAVRRAHTFN